MNNEEIKDNHKRRPGLKLFWRILLWFWLSLATIITVNVFILYINSDKFHIAPLLPMMNDDLHRVEQHLTKNRRHGPRTRHPFKKKDIFLIDANDQSMSGRRIPEMLLELHHKVKESEHPLISFRRDESWFGGAKINYKNGEYWLYLHKNDPPFDKRMLSGFFRDRAHFLFLSIFVISFPFSLFLTLMLTRPIRQMQAATYDLKKSITDRQKLSQLLTRSDEFGELAADFDELAKHIAALVNAQKQMISDVSHELRSPLSRLKIALALIDKKEVFDKKLLERLNIESQRMESMLNSILTISQLSTGQIDHQKVPFDLARTIRLVAEDGQFEATESSKIILTELPKSCQITGNEELITRAIENIVRNALRYASREIKIVLNCANEKANESKVSDNTVLQIIDDGCGVNEENLEKLYDDFYRPQQDRSTDSGGVGLGLAIAKRALQLNNATISAQNNKPKGLIVTICFGADD